MDSLRAVHKELRGLYKKYSVNGVLTNAEMTRYNRNAAMQRQLSEILKPYAVRNTELLRTLTESQYEASFYRTAWSYDNTLRTSLGWGQIPIRQVKAAVWNRYNKGSLARLSIAHRTRLQRAITQGITRGLSLPKMMREVRDALGVTQRQAMMITRTEAHRAREVGHLGASQDAMDKGVELWRVWDAALDSRTRDTHAQLDGKRVKPGESFPGGAEYPGGFGIASEDINCRCTVTDVIEGYEPTGRRVDGEVQPYQTFGEWARSNGITQSRYGQRYNV